MELLILDGEKMISRQAAHETLKCALHLPEYYGGNLDALWDCVSTMEATVEMIHSQQMISCLGSYGEDLLALLHEAQEKNPNFHFSEK